MTMESPLEICRKYGFAHLATRTVDFVAWRTNKAIENSAKTYWNKRGGAHTHTINNTTITYGATTNSGGPTIRNQLHRETLLLTDFLQEISPNRNVWDIGANVGLHTCFALQAPANYVAAFEPYKPNLDALETNIKHNKGPDTAAVNTFQVALSNDNKDMGFAFTAPKKDVVGHGHAGLDPSSATNGGTTVQTITGDSAANKFDIPSPDIVKIDVEGAEYAVLEGIQSQLTNTAVVYVEVHLPASHRPSLRDHGHSVSDVFTLLESQGFEPIVMHSRGEEIQIKATRSKT